MWSSSDVERRAIDPRCAPRQDNGAACNRARQSILAARPCCRTPRSMGPGSTDSYEENEWIMDGDLGPYDAVDVRLRAADTIIFMDFSLGRCAWRAIWRSPERADFWLWLWQYRRQSRPPLMWGIADHGANATLHVLSDSAAVRRFVEEVVRRQQAQLIRPGDQTPMPTHATR